MLEGALGAVVDGAFGVVDDPEESLVLDDDEDEDESDPAVPALAAVLVSDDPLDWPESRESFR